MQENKALFLWFEEPKEIVDHLWQMAWAFAGSPVFDEMPPEEKKEWLFKQCMLADYFQQMKE